MYGGAAPDALAALIAVLASLRDEAGDTTIAGLDNTGTWAGAEYPADRFAADAQVLDGVGLLGSGSVADTVWARPAATVLAIDAPSVSNVTAAIQHEARAVVNLRVPPGQDAAEAQRLLVGPPRGGRPLGCPGHRRAQDARPGLRGSPSADAGTPRWRPACGRRTGATSSRPARAARSRCATRWPTAHPDAEILLIGVEEPACHIHAADESVDPAELERTADGVARMLAELGS